MKHIIIITGILSLWSQLTFAHGENKLGPNGGYIKMPGAFHTEIVPLTPNSLKVYLLDMSWKNPTTLNSSLDLSHYNGKTTKAKCSLEKDHYLCQFNKSIDLKLKGGLTLSAKRENKDGIPVTYELPLKLRGPHANE